MKNILLILFIALGLSTAGQTTKTFRYSQSGFEGKITLPALVDSVEAGLGAIPTITTANNEIATGTGSSNLDGSNQFMFDGNRLIVNRSGTFGSEATIDFQRNPSQTNIQAWRNTTTIASFVDSLGWYTWRGGATKVAIGGVNGSGTSVAGGSAVGLALMTPGGSGTGQADLWYQLNASYTRTSGSAYGFRIERTFAPTSGTCTWGGITIRDVINQTGGANGISYGIWIDPTLTSAADFRAIRYEETTGTGLYISGGSVPNYLGGTLGVGGVTRGASENWFSATDTYITPSDSLKLSGTTIDIAGAVKITGATTATGDITVPAEAYSSSWNGSNEVPTKNDVYDAIQSSDWTNTVTQSGSDTLLNSAAGYGHFQRIGNVVSFTLRVEIALASAGDANTVYIDPPIASDFTTAASDVIGTATMDPQTLSGANTQRQRCVVFASDSDDKIGVSFDPVASLTYPENRMYISVSGSYVIQ